MNSKDKTAHALVAAALSLGISGCDAPRHQPGQAAPLTPQESRAQVVDSARALATTLNLHVSEAYFWRSSCNDHGEGPFRGRLVIRYPRAGSSEESQDQITGMLDRLRGAGWTGDPEFTSHAPTLTKDDVVVVFSPQAVGLPMRSIEVLGECRDITTTKQTRGTEESVSLN